MFIILGQGNYGKIDVAPRVGYVMTRFFHLYYVPLIPLGSYIVVDGSEAGEEFQGVPTRLRWKSVLAAWVRTALVLSVFAGVAVGIVGLIDQMDAKQLPSAEGLFVPWLLAAMSAVGYWLTHRSSRAGYDRAMAIGEALGVPADVVASRLRDEPEVPLPNRSSSMEEAASIK